MSGYSLGTVSRVLNNHPDVSDKARERVMTVVRKENFQSNTNARFLKMQAKSSIAIFVKGTQNVLFADILERIQALLRGSGEEEFVCYLDEDADEVSYALQVCRERQPEGLLFLGGNLEYFRENFSQISLPSVLLTNTARELSFPNLSSFTTDDEAAAGQVIDYLVSMGHRRIGVLGGNLSDSQISCRRIRSCQKRLEQYGLPFDIKKQFEPCRFSMQAGYDAAAQLLRHNPELTAVFALSDVIAFGTMRAARDLGLHVPEDISLIGYDGISISRFSIPRLATIRQDTEQLARQGVDALLQRIHYEHVPVHEVIPFQLIPGESVRREIPDKKG